MRADEKLGAFLELESAIRLEGPAFAFAVHRAGETTYLELDWSLQPISGFIDAPSVYNGRLYRLNFDHCH